MAGVAAIIAAIALMVMLARCLHSCVTIQMVSELFSVFQRWRMRATSGVHFMISVGLSVGIHIKICHYHLLGLMALHDRALDDLSADLSSAALRSLNLDWLAVS